MKTFHKVALLATTAAACLPVAAWSQAQPVPQPVADAAEEVPDIIVTAQKREQSSTDVGISINVRSGDELKQSGVTNTSDLSKIVPALNVTPANTGLYGTPVYTLRGVGFNEKSLSALSAVSIYQDEIPLSYPYMTAGPLLDVQRVEVLKGPQGTLYGQNSTGGSINYVTRKPTTDLTAGGELSYGRFNRVDAEAYLSGAITPTLKARIAGKYIRADGWQVSATRRGDNLGAADQLAGRFILEWKPVSEFRVSLNLNGWRDHSETTSSQIIGINPSNVPYFNGTGPFPDPGASAVVAGLNRNRSIRSTDWTPGLNYRNRNSFKQAALRADYDLTDKFTLTSISSIAKLDIFSPRDFDSVAADLYKGSQDGTIKSFNQEARLSGQLGAATISLGGNYSKDHIKAVGFDNPDGTSLGGFFKTAFGLPTFDTLAVQDAKRRGIAAFGNLDYEIAPRLTLTGGVRYTGVKLDYTGCAQDTGNGTAATFFALAIAGPAGLTNPAGAGKCVTILTTVIPGVGPVPVGQGAATRELKENNVSWRAGLNFKPSRDTLIYGTISRGYKSGDIPQFVAVFDTQLAAVKQEQITAYEIGVKGNAGRVFQASAAAFYYDYRNKQVYGTVLQPAPLNFLAEQTINIPKSRVMGAEAEITIRPTRGFTVRGGVGYTDSKVTKAPLLNVPRTSSTFPLPGGDAFQSSVLASVKGEALNLAPKWQFNTDAQYDWDLSSSLKAFVGANIAYASKTSPLLGADAAQQIDAHAIVDARLGVRNEAQGWRASIWGRNVFSENYAVAIVRTQDSTQRYTGMPSTYGITLGFDFR